MIYSDTSGEGLIQQLVSGSDVVSEPAVAYSTLNYNDSSYIHLAHISRAGLSYEKFKVAIAAFGLSKQQLATILNISDRTLERIHKDKKRLSTPQTERIIEVSMLYEVGWDFFGSKEKFRTWLEEPAYAFDGATPLSMLDTRYGIQSVELLLQRLAHGVAV